MTGTRVWCALAAIALAAMTSLASASPPNGWKCGPGVKPPKDPNADCACPSGKIASRDGDNNSICVAKRSPPPSTTGTVLIDSAPQGAALYVDDDSKIVGYTPWHGRLSIGTHAVTISAQGYEIEHKQLVVARVERDQPLFVPLVKVPDPTRIDVRADGDLYLDGQKAGTAPTMLEVRAGRHLVEIRKSGAPTFSQWVEVASGATVVVAPPVANTGSILVDADVPDADIFVDGNRFPQYTPAIVTNVVEGLHTIEVRKNTAVPWKVIVEVVAGQQKSVHAQLRNPTAGGTVRVISGAPGARAYLDGVDMGPVPVDIKDIKPGDHVLDVKAPGYASFEQRISITAGSSEIVDADLSPSGPSDTGELRVIATAPSDVYVDGAFVSKAPYDARVAAGAHYVVVQAQGYKKFEAKFRVEADQHVLVTAELKAVGELTVVTIPEDATVLVNGIEAGKTPAYLELEVGENVIQIEKAGFKRFEQTITIEGGKSMTLKPTLVRD